MAVIPFEFLWLALAVLVGFTTEVATGFGSIIIALALGSLFLTIDTLLPVLVCANVMMNSVLIYRLRSNIDTGVYCKQIIPLMAIGMVLGIALIPVLPEKIMKLGFAALILWFSIKSLIQNAPSNTQSTNHPLISKLWIWIAGITHGLYASGGPLLVYGLTNISLSKEKFRATLLATWFSLNLIYAIWFLIQGAVSAQATAILGLVPVLIACSLLGQYLHNMVKEAVFKKLVFCLLVLCGLIMLVQVLI